MEAALLVFYGGLLMLTPAFAGLARGRLPIEISARGARFAERADQSAEFADEALRAMEQKIADLNAGLGVAISELEFLKKATEDKRKPRVPSER